MSSDQHIVTGPLSALALLRCGHSLLRNRFKNGDAFGSSCTGQEDVYAPGARFNYRRLRGIAAPCAATQRRLANYPSMTPRHLRIVQVSWIARALCPRWQGKSHPRRTTSLRVSGDDSRRLKMSPSERNARRDFKTRGYRRRLGCRRGVGVGVGVAAPTVPFARR